ncbi:MAG: efflux RND transporter periplasmic adaptor subunit [Acidobacteria bacterium]|nr:efflux RND transporter periplasmic adaptor subunit [Acidobacteriota bacterium]
MKLKFGITKRALFIAIGVIAVGLTAGYLYFGRSTSAEDYLTAKIEKGNIRNTVSATGALQAVTTVQVGSQVSGNIAELYADFNSIVRKDQVVARLDPSILQAQVSQQRANLEQARANLANSQARLLAAESDVKTQRAGVSGATANLAALKAQRDDAARLLERQEALAKSGIIPERDLEAVRASFQTAEARYSQADAQLDQARVNEQNAGSAGLAQAKAQVQQASAQVQQSEAALRLAEVNLSHTTITSPIDGVVVSRNVDKGQTVAASLSAPTLFTIANDLTQMQVIAAIDQADIGAINSNNRVSFTVDAFPGNNFQGTINQIRLNAQNVQNVVTYNVVIDVRNPDLKLKPGMTANLTFSIAERNDTLKIPNAALRFRPQDITPEKMRELLRGAPGNEPAQAKTQADAKPAGSPGNEAGQARRRERDQQAGGPGAEGFQGRRRERDQQAGGPGAEVFQGRNRERDQQAGGPGGEWGQGRRRERDQQAGGPGAEGFQGRRRERDQQAGGPGGEGGQGRRRERDQQAGAPGSSPEGGARSDGPRFTGFAPSTSAVVEGQWRVVWTLGPDKKPQPRRIQIGITDGSATEILRGDLKEGELIIVGLNITSDTRTPNRQSPPGFGGAPGRGFGGGGPGGGGGRR